MAAKDHHDSEAGSGPSSLSRALGPRIALAVVVGNVIGSGIYLKPGTIAASGLGFTTIISVWVVGGLLCILGAICFAELAAMLPKAGGLYVYLSAAYGRPVAFLFGWTEFLVRVPGSIAALAVAFVGNLFLAFGWEQSPSAIEVLTCSLVIAALAWVNILGVLWGGRLQMFFTVIKAATLALVGLAPILLAPAVDQSIDFSNYSSNLAAGQSTQQPGAESYAVAGDASLFTRVGIVLLAVMWAYNGWHGITPLAEEVRDPQRSIPRALLGGVGILIVLYLLANFAYHGVLSMREMAEASTDASARMLEKLIGQAGLVAIAGIIMCSTFGAMNTNLLQAPRISFAMGRDGVFFRGLGRVHGTYRTPAAAIFITAAMAIFLIVIAAVAKGLAQDVNPQEYEWEINRKVLSSLKSGKLFNLLTDFVIFAASIFYTLAVLAVIVLRFRRPDLDRPYKTWGYPLVPVAFIAVYVWFLSQVYLEKPLEAHAGLFLIALGIPTYFLFRLFAPRNPG